MDGAVGEARQHVGQILADRHSELAAAAMNFHKLRGVFGLYFLSGLLGVRGQFLLILAPLGPQMPCETT